MIDSCHNTWEFEPDTMRYRRHVKGAGRNAVVTDWTPYWGVLFEEDSDSFVVLLNEEGTRILRSYSHLADCTECASQHTEQLDLAAIRQQSDERD
jgi:hypothetical protein